MSATPEARVRLRRILRRARRELSPEAREYAQSRVARFICASPWFRSAKRIGLYLAFDGELEIGEVIRIARRMGKSVYVPIVTRDMQFACLSSELKVNAFGIREPSNGATGKAPNLDLVLVPLVGFDARGSRLGMGGGHYDRYFRQRLLRRHWRRPKLLGVAFELQRVEHLDPAHWDVPLDAIVTERGLAQATRE